MPAPPPNLLLITTDQHRGDALGCARHPAVFTPNFNWLADEGVRFTRAYTDCPMCMPARATIMTGRHGWRQGLTANKTQNVPAATHPTLPGLLTAAGYQTRAVGKMHFHPVRAHYGFEHMELPFDYVRERAAVGGPLPFDHGLGQNEMEPALSTTDDAHSLTRWTVRQRFRHVQDVTELPGSHGAGVPLDGQCCHVVIIP